MRRILATLFLGLAAIAVSAQVPYPKTIDSGAWNSGHMQGIALDRDGYMYYSFTDVLVKTDLSGRLIPVRIIGKEGDSLIGEID